MRTSRFYSASLACLFVLCARVYAAPPPAGLLYLLEGHAEGILPPGGVAAGATPSGDMINGGLRVTTRRVPTARVEVLTPAPTGGSTTASTLTRHGYALVSARKPLQLGSRTRLTGEVVYRAAGRFQRVDEEGTSVHAFPEHDLAAGAALSRRVSSRFAIGAGLKWVRGKRLGPEGAAEVGSGVVFDVGAVLRPQPPWRVGVAVRNLSDGLSYSGLTPLPDTRNEVVLSSDRTIALSTRATLTFAADVRLPSKDGTQGSASAAIASGGEYGASVGYIRRVAPLDAESGLPDDGFTSEVRIWRAMGPTASAWLRLGGVEVSVGVGPSYLPTELADETHAVREGRLQWMVGLGPAR